VSIILRCIQVLLSFLVTAALARNLSVAEFGRVSAVIATASLVSVVVAMGLPSVLLRAAGAKSSYASRVRRTGAAWHLVALVLVIESFPLAGADPKVYAAVLLGIFMSAVVFRAADLRARGAVLSALTFEGIAPQLLSLVGFWIVIVYIGQDGSGITTNSLIGLILCAWFTSLLMIEVLCFKIRKPAPKTDQWGARPLREGFDFLGTNVLIVVFAQLGFFATLLLSGDAESGIYRIAAQVASLSTLGAMALSSAFSYRIPDLYSSGAREELARICGKVALGGAAFAALLLIFLTLAGMSIIVAAFGEEFSGAYEVILILSATHLYTSLCGPAGTMLSLCGHPREVVLAMTCSIIVATISSLVLTPEYGATGSAMAYCLGAVLWSTLLTLRAKKILGIRSDALTFLRK